MTTTNEKKVSTTNTIYMIVEPTYSENEFSVLVYDEHNLFVEKLVYGFEKAIEAAEKLFNKYTS